MRAEALHEDICDLHRDQGLHSASEMKHKCLRHTSSERATKPDRPALSLVSRASFSCSLTRSSLISKALCSPASCFALPAATANSSARSGAEGGKREGRAPKCVGEQPPPRPSSKTA